MGGILDELTLKGGKLEDHSRKIIHFQYETQVRSGVEYTKSRSNTRTDSLGTNNEFVCLASGTVPQISVDRGLILYILMAITGEDNT